METECLMHWNLCSATV